MSKRPEKTSAEPRRLPIGAEVQADGATHFRVWAARSRRVELVLHGGPQAATPARTLEMAAEADGYFSLLAPQVPAGTRYGYLLDGRGPFADPASRFQPEGPEGPSQVVDTGSFAWTDAAWPGVKLAGQVLYEMHVGTFTPQGTWRAAKEQLAELVELGVTLLEIMPIADWPGDFGWGYDGVCLFAPMRLYGPPDDLRSFVDRAHALGIGVLLDVVYNHFGEAGCSLGEFSEDYFSTRYENEWGRPVNFDGPNSGPVREFVLANTRYWIEEFHFDGYRIDATQAFFDESPENILAAITRTARAAGGQRSVLIVAESEPQEAKLIRPTERGGVGMDAAWNDDFHHSALVRLTGRNEAYFTDYLGTAEEFVSLVKWGYLYQGQRYKWQQKPRGSPALDLPPAAFVNYLQNHDQIANTGLGLRIDRLSSPSRLRAMTALWLLMPETPILFQGQEFAASTPFCYFLDNPPDRAASVAEGRASFLRQFPSLALPEMQRRLADPADPLTYRKCKLNFDERHTHGPIYALHKDLLALRRADPAICQQRRDRLDAQALSRDALVLRYFQQSGDDRLLVVNFGVSLHYNPAPQPLLAPPEGGRWQILWSSESPKYGGSGTPELDTDEGWRIPGEAAVLLESVALKGADPQMSSSEVTKTGGSPCDVPISKSTLRRSHPQIGELETPVINRMPWASVVGKNPQQLLDREWIVTNGLGGYAAGTVAGACTRRYHGLLIAALQVPLGRTMMFNHLAEEMRLGDGQHLLLGSEDLPDGAALHGEAFLSEFSLRMGLPVWHYQGAGFELEKRVVMPHGQNTVLIYYRLLSGDGHLRLRFRPAFHFRGHDDSVGGPLEHPYQVTGCGDRFEVTAPALPPLRMRLVADSAALVLDGGRTREVLYRVEASRGYDSRGMLWSPGYFRADLVAGEEAVLIASTEDWEISGAVPPELALNSELDRRARLLAQADVRARDGVGAELVLAADQFIIRPTARSADAARAHATGDEIRTVIAGYYWFGDWGRDTMISLEGLTLCTGRTAEACWILRTFANYVRDGLIPNLFPEGKSEGLYHTADASLWFFHAVDRYVQATGDRATLRYILPRLEEIVTAHFRGTRFGIGVDPADGLLKQGAQGYQLTWMDAKVGDWVVTPRRGKAVEICALWYNALKLFEGWLREEQHDAGRADDIAAHAAQARESFNRRFWNPKRQCLYDVVDGETGDDASLRPNQVLAISLEHPVLDQNHWKPVLDVVTERLLTPAGLRSLAPGEPDYKPRYDGDLRSRDAAYHQGTVWAWLIGPFVDAWLKVTPGDRKTVRQFLVGFVPHLGEACLGSISEVFDAEAPYTPRGCPAQAWSVAEVLRSWIKTAQ